MAVTFVNSATVYYGSATSFPITVPSGVQAGDLLVLLCNNNFSPTGRTWDSLSGWTRQFEQASSSVQELAVYWRIADATCEAGDTVTPTNSALTDAAIALVAWRGPAGTLVDTHAVVVDAVSTTSHALDASAITADGQALAVFGKVTNANFTSSSPPAGYTEALDAVVLDGGAVPATSFSVDWKEVGAGSLGTLTGSTVSSVKCILFALAFVVEPAPPKSRPSVPDRLHILVQHGDGRTTRWGPGDQTDRLLNDLTFSTASPGGFRDLTCQLLRDLRPQTDEGLLDTITVYGPGSRIVWQGRILQLPRETGDANKLSPSAVGWSAHLADKKSVRRVYVDRDMSRWGAMPLNYRIAMATAGNDIASLSWANDAGLTVPLPNQALGANVLSEAWYVAPAAVNIATIQYRGTEAIPAGYQSARFNGYNDDAGGGLAAYTITLDDTIRTRTITSPTRYLSAPIFTAGTAATPAAGNHRTFKRLAAYGNHGLTLRATVAGYPDGIYLSDIIAHTIGQDAPLLHYTTGTDGTIQTNTFVVPQAAYLDFTTAADIVANMNAYVGWDWLVYDGPLGPTFYFQPAGSGVQWRARRSDGARLRLDGESSDVIVNKMYVEYDDGTGKRFTAGPPGSGMDITDASLEDTSSEHPVNSHGITEKSEIIRPSSVTNEAGAIALGAIALYARNAATRRGQITLTGTVEHPTEGLVPVWRVRAGDTILVTDVEDDVQRRIIQVDYTHQTRTASLTLDNTPGLLDALTERLAVAGSFFNF